MMCCTVIFTSDMAEKNSGKGAYGVNSKTVIYFTFSANIAVAFDPEKSTVLDLFRVMSLLAF